MKRCPYCDEEVRENAIKCKHCGSILAGTDTDTLDRQVTIAGTPGGLQYDTLDAAATEGAEAAVLAGQYRIVKKIGEGGMGIVYLAQDLEMGNRAVAIKVLPPLLSRNIRAVENLRKEAITAINLNHPNIIRLYGFHSDGDIKFLVMEYIDGQTLEEKVIYGEQGKLTLEEILPIAEQIAGALDYAHRRKPPVFHRDLKPSNVMIDKSGQVKLLDFGIAREMKDSYTRVTGQETSGTVPYMSPQQINGEAPNPPMDIYSFGVTLYECMAGHTPFYTGDIKHQIFSKRPADMADVPEHINVALQAALAKKVSDRPATGAALVEMLKEPGKAAGKIDEMLPEAEAPRAAPDAEAAIEKIRRWVENRKADWTEDEWKDFVITLYDDGCAVGMHHSRLEKIREREKKAWLKAEEGRKAEEARIAEERRRAAEEAESKREAAEEARRRREQEQLFEEIKSSPTVHLCERYLNQYPAGPHARKVDKTLARLRSERKHQLRLVKVLSVEAVIAVVVGYLVVFALNRGRPRSARRPSGVTKAVGTAVGTEAGESVTNSIGMKLVYIPSGEFVMGSPSYESQRGTDEGPQHRVKISKGFYMGVYEVTQAQWKAMMGASVRQQRDKANKNWPLRGEGGNHPIYYVNWDEATEFCRKLSQKEGKTYRLPTEAEWENACRAGTTTRFGFGDSDSDLGNYAWYSSNSSSSTHGVGKKRPNAFGLYDMHGNVWEWCSDWYDEDYYSKSPGVDPQGPNTGTARVLRGGSWGIDPWNCRSAYRSGITPGFRIINNGFRVVALDF